VCHQALGAADGTVSCPAGHSFDIARQGYLSLLPGDASPGTADTAEMVAARASFLDRGHYAPIAEAVSEAIPTGDGVVIDLGGGTGYYLAAVLDAHPGSTGIAIDLSRLALRRAARAHPRAGAIVADVWKPLPIRSGAALAVLSIFSPRNAPEIARILGPHGVLVVVTPTARHLAELVSSLGMITVDERKQERLDTQLRDFRRLSNAPLEYEIELSHDDVLAVVLMGPSAHHLDAAALARDVAGLAEPLRVTVSVAVAVYAPGP